MAGGSGDMSEVCPVDKVLSTPELMNIILGKVDFNDVKNFRAASRNCREKAMYQVAERGIIELDLRTGERRDQTMIQRINAIRADEFRHFRVFNNMPKNFETNCKNTISTLHLKDVCFPKVEDFRRVIFQSFPGLKELGLKDVLLSKNARNEPLDLTTKKLESAPKVERLIIEQVKWELDKRRGYDIFFDFTLDELVRNYSESLKCIDCLTVKAICRAPRQDMFRSLSKYEVRLTSFAWNFRMLEEVDSCKDYVTRFGGDLVGVKIHTLFGNLFNEIFENAPVQQIESLMVTMQYWTSWEGADFSRLRSIHLTSLELDSFSFLSRMPNIQEVQLETLVEEPEYRHIQAPTVKTMKLYVYDERTTFLHLVPSVFPNVVTLDISQTKDSDGLSAGIYDTLWQGWPGLLHLKLAVNIDENLRKWRGLQRRNRQEDSDMPFLRSLLRLPDLRSFDCQKVDSDQVWFGNESAHEVFLAMPNLRTLQIGSCSMTESVIEELRAKLIVFTYLRTR